MPLALDFASRRWVAQLPRVPQPLAKLDRRTWAMWVRGDFVSQVQCALFGSGLAGTWARTRVSGNIQINVGRTTTASTIFTTSNLIPANVWICLAFTFDVTTGVIVAWMIDRYGKVTQLGTATSGSGPVVDDTANGWWLGARSATDVVGLFDIGPTATWNRVLSVAELAAWAMAPERVLAGEVFKAFPGDDGSTVVRDLFTGRIMVNDSTVVGAPIVRMWRSTRRASTTPFLGLAVQYAYGRAAVAGVSPLAYTVNPTAPTALSPVPGAFPSITAGNVAASAARAATAGAAPVVASTNPTASAVLSPLSSISPRVASTSPSAAASRAALASVVGNGAARSLMASAAAARLTSVSVSTASVAASAVRALLTTVGVTINSPALTGVVATLSYYVNGVQQLMARYFGNIAVISSHDGNVTRVASNDADVVAIEAYEADVTALDPSTNVTLIAGEP